MKKLLLFALLFGMWDISWGQDFKQSITKGNYFLDGYISLDKLELPNDNLFKGKINNFKGKDYKLFVKSIQDDIVYFEFWDFNNPETNKIVNGINNDQVYSLPLSEFRKIVSPIYNRVDWRVGIYTVPFKLRFDDFDFDANVNIGTNIGAKIRVDRSIENGVSLEPIFGFGLSSIKLDDSNSNAISATNVSAFTLNTGVLLHMTNEINVGLTYGWDNLSGKDQQNYSWKHNGKGWVGLGINVAFSKPAKNTGDRGNN